MTTGCAGSTRVPITVGAAIVGAAACAVGAAPSNVICTGAEDPAVFAAVIERVCDFSKLGLNPHTSFFDRNTRGTQRSRPSNPARKNTQPRLSTNELPVNPAGGNSAGCDTVSNVCENAGTVHSAEITEIARTLPNYTK
jgi:hypothetical protein